MTEGDSCPLAHSDTLCSLGESSSPSRGSCEESVDRGSVHFTFLPFFFLPAFPSVIKAEEA